MKCVTSCNKIVATLSSPLTMLSIFCFSSSSYTQTSTSVYSCQYLWLGHCHLWCHLSTIFLGRHILYLFHIPDTSSPHLLHLWINFEKARINIVDQFWEGKNGSRPAFSLSNIHKFVAIHLKIKLYLQSLLSFSSHCYRNFVHCPLGQKNAWVRLKLTCFGTTNLTSNFLHEFRHL